jgi:hypothetical protein
MPAGLQRLDVEVEVLGGRGPGQHLVDPFHFAQRGHQVGEEGQENEGACDSQRERQQEVAGEDAPEGKGSVGRREGHDR